MKRVLSLLISAILIISSLGISVSASDFSGHWSEAAINVLMSNGVISGDSFGNIRPDDHMTRAEFVKVVNKYIGYTVKASANFADVDASKWYADEFLIAKATGYITGDDKGFANPDAQITRAEVCVILSRLLSLKENTLVSFTDSHLIPAWAKGYIGAMYAKGLVSGYEDGSFKADNNITRGEVFSLVTRVNKADVKAPSAVADTSDMYGNISAVKGNSFGGGGSSGGGGGSSGSGSVSAPEIYAPVATFTPAAAFDIATKTLSFESRFASKFNVKVNVTEVIPGKQNEFVFADVAKTSLGGDIYSIDFTAILDSVVTQREMNNETFTVSLEVVATSGASNVPYTQIYSGVYVKELPKPDTLVSVPQMDGAVMKYNLSWNAPANETVEDYKVIIKNAETGAVIEEVTTTTTAYVVDTSLPVYTGVDLSKLVFAVQAKIAGLYSGDSDSKTIVLAKPEIKRVEYYPADNSYKIVVSHPETVTYKYRLGTTELTPNSRGRLVIPAGTITDTNIPAGFEVKAINGINESAYALYPYDFTFAGGEGTSESPYYIADYRQFKNIKKKLANQAYFQQTADITIPSGYVPFEDGFNGTYDGGEYTLTLNLEGAGNSTSGYSLFGKVSNATFKNVITKGSIKITGSGHIYGAVISGYASGITLDNCVNYAEVTGSDKTVGAFIGRLTSGTIENCINYGKITAKNNVGGFVGWIGAGSIKNSTNFGEVNGQNSGGFAGIYNSADISNCANIGKIYGTSGYNGGLLGYLGAKGDINISGSYNAGEITGAYAGGLVGATYHSSYATSVVIKDSYNTGKLIGKTTNGSAIGFFGNKETKLEVANFYDIANPGIDVVTPRIEEDFTAMTPVLTNAYVLNATGSVTYGTSITDAELKAVPAGFDPEKWEIGSSASGEYNYPELKTNKYAGNEVPEIPGGGTTPDPEEPGQGGGGTTPDPDEPGQGGEETHPLGSEQNPYLVATADEFIAIFGKSGSEASKLAEGVYIKQTADITLPSSYVSRGIVTSTLFKGVYDGDGHTINVSIDGSGTAKGENSIIGGVASTGIVKNVVTRGTVNTAQQQSGVLVGYLNGGTVLNCVNFADITSSQSYTGGIIGYVNAGSSLIEKCYNYGTVTVTAGSYIGGIAGSLNGGTIRYCGNIGDVIADAATDVAGIAGMSTGRTTNINNILYCYNAGDITGKEKVAAITGRTYFDNKTVLTANIENCYNTGVVSGTKSVGIILGQNYKEKTVSGGKQIVTIKNCYDTANPSLQIVGSHLDDFVSADESYYNKTVVENAYVLNSTATLKVGASITDAELKAIPAGFDSAVWVKGSTEAGKYQYPELKDNLYETEGNIGGGSEPVIQDGTEEHPYLVATADEFIAIFGKSGSEASKLAEGVHIKQTADIVFTAPYTSRGISSSFAFKGIYDGNGYTITVYSAGDTTDKGTASLFGSVGVGGVVKNVTTLGTLTGELKNQNSPIVGLLNGGSVLNCINYADVTATGSNAKYIAGIVGHSNNTDSIVDGCYNFGDINADSTQVAGIMGSMDGGTIRNCGNIGDITGKINTVGGITGQISGRGTKVNNIINCYNAGDVKGTKLVGGIAGKGYFNNATVLTVNIENCYNTGIVTGDSSTGSLVGETVDKAAVAGGKVTHNIINCYDIANPGLQLIGHFAENTDNTEYFNKLTVTNSYVLNATTTLTAGETITDAELKAVPSGFDSAVWAKGSTEEGKYQYPELKGNPYKKDANGGSTTPDPEEPGQGGGGSTPDPEEPGQGGGSTTPDPVTVTINGVTFNTNGETEATAFEIKTADEFEKIFSTANTNDVSYLSGKYFFKLKEDITLSTAYAPSATKFAGVFDGNNKTITFQTGTEENPVTFDATIGFGLFVSPISGSEIKNVITAGSIYCGEETYVAAIAGGSTSYANITNCVNNATISQSGASTSGIVARVYGPTTIIKDCVNNGEIKGKGNVAGITGWGYSGNIIGCVNNGTITGTNIAGIVGAVNSITISGCANTGSLIGVNAGGMIASTGSKGTVVIEKSYNSGNVNGTTSAAGMYTAPGHGKPYFTTLTITDCYNTGVIEAPSAGLIFALINVDKNGAPQASVTITGYYDSTNPSLSVAKTIPEGASVTLTNIYAVDSTATHTSGATSIAADDIKGKLPAGFSDSVWQAVDGDYPILK